MCVDPFTMMAVAGAVASFGGTMMQAQGQMQQAQAQNQQAIYMAQVNENNAKIARQNAVDARERGKAAVDEVQRKNAQRMGQQTAAMAANGLDMSSGSPLDVLVDTKAMGTLDTLTTYNAYDREAMSHFSKRNDFQAEAHLSRMRGASALEAGRIGARATMIGGVGNMFSAIGKIS